MCPIPRLLYLNTWLWPRRCLQNLFRLLELCMNMLGWWEDKARLSPARTPACRNQGHTFASFWVVKNSLLLYLVYINAKKINLSFEHFSEKSTCFVCIPTVENASEMCPLYQTDLNTNGGVNAQLNLSEWHPKKFGLTLCDTDFGSTVILHALSAATTIQPVTQIAKRNNFFAVSI